MFQTLFSVSILFTYLATCKPCALQWRAGNIKQLFEKFTVPFVENCIFIITFEGFTVSRAYIVVVCLMLQCSIVGSDHISGKLCTSFFRLKSSISTFLPADGGNIANHPLESNCLNREGYSLNTLAVQQKILFFLCEIWFSQSSVVEDPILLGCYTVLTDI
jgi:hypothetical protein